MASACVVLTPPDGEPLTLSEAKAHLRLDHDGDDEYVSALIAAARDLVERDTRRALLAQTRRLSLEGFPCGRVIELPGAPLGTVTSVEYVPRGEGERVTLDTSAYLVDADSTPGAVELVEGALWPATASRRAAVQITYTCGYATPEDIPPGLLRALKFVLAHLYENREPVITGTIVAELPFGLRSMLARYRVWSIA